MAGVPDINAAVYGIAVNKSDTTILNATRALWVGGAGDLSVQFANALGATVVLKAAGDGALIPISVVRVMAATTATDVVALY